MYGGEGGGRQTRQSYAQPLKPPPALTPFAVVVGLRYGPRGWGYGAEGGGRQTRHGFAKPLKPTPALTPFASSADVSRGT